MIELLKEKGTRSCVSCQWYDVWQQLLARLELPQSFVASLSERMQGCIPRIQAVKLQKSASHTIGFATHRNFWIFRDDESGGLLGGTKNRKWHGIVCWCLAEHVDLVGLEGGKSSANVLLGLLRLAETGIAHCWLNTSAHLKSEGRLVSPVERLLGAMGSAPLESDDQWQIFLKKQNAKNPLFLKEGAYHISAIAGLFSLVAQLATVIRSERYTDLLIESGSGLTALACVLGFALLGKGLPDFRLHILHLATSQADFEAQLRAVCGQQRSKLESFATAVPSFWLKLQELNLKMADLPKRTHHVPSSAKSFGSVNSGVKKTAEYYFRNCGIICDPIYTAKTLMLAEELTAGASAAASSSQMKLLVLNAGGAINLLGFLPRS